MSQPGRELRTHQVHPSGAEPQATLISQPAQQLYQQERISFGAGGHVGQVLLSLAESVGENLLHCLWPQRPHVHLAGDRRSLVLPKPAGPSITTIEPSPRAAAESNWPISADSPSRAAQRG